MVINRLHKSRALKILKHLNFVKVSGGSSVGDSKLSESEVGGLLLGSDGLDFLLVLGETGSGGLGALGSKILWSVLLGLPGVLGGGSSLLVHHGQELGDVLSNNLK